MTTSFLIHFRSLPFPFRGLNLSFRIFRRERERGGGKGKERLINRVREKERERQSEKEKSSVYKILPKDFFKINEGRNLHDHLFSDLFEKQWHLDNRRNTLNIPRGS